ncbi:hypothetical protein ACIBBB_35585 [Streptomyces sp. NPDC051217]|uniref:hypothetical protein n=1 Tax=Streptomyces sp. NPDC051217 TaxID=3365644 RepID=UPI0037A69638
MPRPAKPEDLLRGQWQHNRTSVLDEYKLYLDERWDEGCTNAWKLWEEIVPLGYRGGSYGRVSTYLREMRTSPRPVTALNPGNPPSKLDFEVKVPTGRSRNRRTPPGDKMDPQPTRDAEPRSNSSGSRPSLPTALNSTP